MCLCTVIDFFFLKYLSCLTVYLVCVCDSEGNISLGRSKSDLGNHPGLLVPPDSLWDFPSSAHQGWKGMSLLFLPGMYFNASYSYMQADLAFVYFCVLCALRY